MSRNRSSTAPARLFIAAVAAAVTTGVTPSAHAEDDAAARALAIFHQAKIDMNDGRFDAACREFADSKALDPGAGTILNLAYCYEKAGKAAQAWMEYGAAIVAAHNAGRIIWEKAARARAAAIEPTLRWVVLRLEKPRASVALEIRIDGAIVPDIQIERPIPVEPGEHEVRVTSADRKPWSSTFEAGGDHVPTVVVPELEPVEGSAPVAAAHEAKPQAQSSGPPAHRGLGVQRTLSIVVAGVGVGSLAAAAGFGLAALSTHGAADCLDDKCTSSGISERDVARQQATVADVFTIAGGVLLGGAAALWWISPNARVRLGPTTGRAGLGVTAEGQW
jgi:hypothetical protein